MAKGLGQMCSSRCCMFPAMASARAEQLPWGKLFKPTEELSISNNRLSVEGALQIAAGLKENKTLKGLNMTRNPTQSEGCCGALKALQANSSTGIEILDLPDIPVSKELAELRDAVKILFPNLLRHGGNTKLQRTSQLKAELWTQPKAVGNSQNTVA